MYLLTLGYSKKVGTCGLAEISEDFITEVGVGYYMYAPKWNLRMDFM